MLIEKLPAEELAMIDKYRKYYAAHSEGDVRRSAWHPINEVLAEWDTCKQKLYHMFGNKFILRRNFAYEPSIYELEKKIAAWTQEEGDDFIRKFSEMISFYGKVWDGDDRGWGDVLYEDLNCYSNRNNMYSLVYPHALAKNSWTYDDFQVNYKGQEIKVSKGMKITRALNRFAKAFGLTEEYEKFRIRHSQILNQKRISGVLNLSIHPLDYMTMSDNNCNWESCMSWQNEGGYRSGTVEMMNSPMVVVAYLTSSKEFYPLDKGNEVWSNKKWRQLFVINDEVLASIKAYPYSNDSITSEVMNWLKELAAAQDITFGETTIVSDEDFTSNYYRGPKFDTRYMYNDFGCAESHMIAVAGSDDLLTLDGKEYNYSGRMICMACGEIEDGDFYDESFLLCPSCEHIDRCDECGCWGGELYWVNGRHLCEDCYNEMTFRCEYCEDEAFNDDEVLLKVFGRDERGNIYWNHRYALSFCCKDCLERWVDNSLKENLGIHTFDLVSNEYEDEFVFSDIVGVFWDEINLDRIDGYHWINDYTSLKDYTNSCFGSSDSFRVKLD